MTEKTIRRLSVSRRTLLSGTGAVIGHRALLAAGYSASEKAMLFSGTAKRVYRLA